MKDIKIKFYMGNVFWESCLNPELDIKKDELGMCVGTFNRFFDMEGARKELVVTLSSKKPTDGYELILPHLKSQRIRLKTQSGKNIHAGLMWTTDSKVQRIVRSLKRRYRIKHIYASVEAC